MNTRWLSFLLALSPLTGCLAKDKEIPPEVGHVSWQKSYPTVLAEAKKSNKPIFALFQEVPG